MRGFRHYVLYGKIDNFNFLHLVTLAFHFGGMGGKTGSYDPVAGIQSQIGVLLHLSISYRHCLFCIEYNGHSVAEYFWLEGHQVQNMKVLNFSILKLMLKTLHQYDVL